MVSDMSSQNSSAKITLLDEYIALLQRNIDPETTRNNDNLICIDIKKSISPEYSQEEIIIFLRMLYKITSSENSPEIDLSAIVKKELSRQRNALTHRIAYFLKNQDDRGSLPTSEKELIQLIDERKAEKAAAKYVQKLMKASQREQKKEEKRLSRLRKKESLNTPTATQKTRADRQLLALSLFQQGFSNAAIAKQIGVSGRTTYRWLEDLRKKSSVFFGTLQGELFLDYIEEPCDYS